MNILKKINQLNLPNDQFVVVGGGVLVALGLLEWDGDIDIAVSPKVFDGLKRQGWLEAQWEDKTVLKHDVYDVGTSFGAWNLQELKADALIISEIPFINLEKLLEWKRRVNRAKDQEHIKLIERYQQSIEEVRNYGP